jgi:hypothetical protein
VLQRPRPKCEQGRLVIKIQNSRFDTLFPHPTRYPVISANATAPNNLSVINLYNTQTAVLEPSNIDPFHTFQSQTFDAQMTCISLNTLCDVSNVNVIESCADVGFPAIPTDDSHTMLGQVGNDTVELVRRRPWLLASNRQPRTTGYAAQIVEPLMKIYSVHPNLAISVLPVPEIAIYAVCDLTVVNGMLEFTNGM